MTDPQTLLNQAKCYICLGVTLEQALELALLAQIATGGTGGGGGSGAGLVLGPWIEPQLPGWPTAGTPGQEVLLHWVNTTGKIQWFQCSVALFSGVGNPSICDFTISNPVQPNYSPQTTSGDEQDFFFSAILAPGESVNTVFDGDAANGHRVQTVWYRTLT